MAPLLILSLRQNSLIMTHLHGIKCAMRILSLLAALVLIIALSVEIVGGDNVADFSPWYLGVQFVVCLIFIVDFAVNWTMSDNRTRYFFRNFIVLLLSVPYLNIIQWSGAGMTRGWAMVVGMITLLRAFVAMYMVIRLLIEGNTRQLFVAYIFTVVVFTYLSGLIFYDYEIHVNPHLEGFGNAIWWAWMGVTTVGAAIFPVTVAGKTFAVLLPILGMMMFPIFTIYVTDLYNRKKKGAR